MSDYGQALYVSGGGATISAGAAISDAKTFRLHGDFALNRLDIEAIVGTAARAARAEAQVAEVMAALDALGVPRHVIDTRPDMFLAPAPTKAHKGRKPRVPRAYREASLVERVYLAGGVRMPRKAR